MDYFCLESRASALVADLEEYSNKKGFHTDSDQMVLSLTSQPIK